MKKLVIAASVLACAAIVTATSVPSQNIVGYSKVDVTGDALNLVALNFQPGNNLVTELIGSQLPWKSTIYVWDKTTDGYRTYVKSGRSAPGAWPAAAYIDQGEAMWVQPFGAGTYTLSFLGEVKTTANSVAVAATSPFEMSGFYYPVNVAFGDTDLSAQLVYLSKVHFWNGTGYETYIRSGRAAPGAWNAAAQARVIGLNEGFWIETGNGGPMTWNESVPFTP